MESFIGKFSELVKGVLQGLTASFLKGSYFHSCQAPR